MVNSDHADTTVVMSIQAIVVIKHFVSTAGSTIPDGEAKIAADALIVLRRQNCRFPKTVPEARTIQGETRHAMRNLCTILKTWIQRPVERLLRVLQNLALSDLEPRYAWQRSPELSRPWRPTAPRGIFSQREWQGKKGR
jgi:hypothetical protein